MKNLTLRNIASACGGRYLGRPEDLDREVTDIATDSRQVQPGGLFAAIVGERVDAHRFIPQVFAAGALAVLCEKEPEDPAGNCIIVEDTQKALMAVAEFYRQQLDIRVVGITGSVGKTSTKEMIASVLSEKYRVCKTLGNFNNELGLPLTVFRLRPEDQVAVLEMGINHFGEMHRLAKIARPDICVITNIGTCHLEFLGDRDGVLRAKSEIFDFLSPDGQIVLNGDDDKLAGIREVRGIEPAFFGLSQKLDFYARDMENDGIRGVSCAICHSPECFRVKIPVPGEHMVRNALAAAAVGTALGMTPEEIRRGIEKLETISGRFHVIEKNGVTVVDDCYNANPMSMKASLSALAGAEGRKVAILGDMGELGKDEEELHREVGRFLGGLSVQLCICVGPLSRGLALEAAGRNPDLQVVLAQDLQEALQGLPEWIREGDTVLVKASHFMHFEQIVEALTRQEA